MRTAVMLSAGAALMMTTGASGQMGGQMGAGTSYPAPGAMAHMPPSGPPVPQVTQTARTMAEGHWWGGNNAPGGWAAYRQPVRGERLTGYWVAPRFAVNDWNRYGFAAPARGDRWSRYYDDAVLIDARGQVLDSVGGVDWNGYSRRNYASRNSGLGGAAIGAVAGGVAGNVIAGRGNRLGGTLIGAGVGGAAGYAIDRSAHRADDRYRGPPPEYRMDDRGRPMAGDYPPYDRSEQRVYRQDGPGYPGPDGSRWRSADGSTTVVTTTGGYPGAYGGYGNGGYYGSGYSTAGYSSGGYYNSGYAYGGGVTTVTVQSAPVVTTTTTEVIDDRVTYARAAAHHVYRAKRVYHPRPRRRAVCSCGS